MRPYQIAATERIIERIKIANNYKLYGKIEGGGYIWHTTGSGKTLTSFKTAQLASRLDYIDKVLFVVDRKDLDYQTMKEYNRFEEGAADSNSSTAVLQRQLENKDKNGAYHDYKIIITTIQKLSIFVQKNKGHEIFQKHVVIIFDECHRSNFGEMHTAITYLIDNNYVDCIIQLPDNLFFGTSIATCIMVLKKAKKDNSTLFIDASKECVKITNNNKLTPDNIGHIVQMFADRKDVQYQCKLVSNDTIAAGDYNLSVSTYVEQEDTREKVDIAELNARIEKIVAHENELRAQIDEIIKAL